MPDLIIVVAQSDAKFSLGQLFSTPGAMELLSAEEMTAALMRHQRGDWGDLCHEDKEENERGLREEGRLFSAYTAKNDSKFWIITEWDRSVTTVLLPSEY